VTPKHLARVHATLRVKLRLRQSDVAQAAGIDRSIVGAIEHGRITAVRVGDAQASFAALGATLSIGAFYEGANLERILDEVHARLTGAVVQILKALGWVVKVEASFAVRGERGSIDVLGYHEAQQALLVIEVKSELPGVDPLLRPLDVKARIAPEIATRQFGWRPLSVSRVVVFPEDRTARRLVGQHAGVLRAALPDNSRTVRKWLRQPKNPIAGIWFLTTAASTGTMRNPSTIRRVRRPRRSVAAAQKPASAAELRLIDPHTVDQDSS
jgi:transcriptional regulator with XRE-family HTH domain